MEFKQVNRAKNDIYFNADGSRHIDMFAANGTLLLGHGNETVVSEVRRQLELAWNTGVLQTPIREQARSMVERYFPDTYGLAGFCSTGMEAAEFAIRIARVTTGRHGVIGFENSMHGKSVATSYLGWENEHLPAISHYARLPFPRVGQEEEILERLDEVLKKGQTSAIFIEPLQGSGGGHMAPASFYQEVFQLCSKSGTLLILDEILTGFYRTGNAFFHTDIGFMPDIVLIGKAMGNGFPVSGVVVNKNYPIRPAMLPGSTYAGNPLASAAVVGTLRAMSGMPLPQIVTGMERTIVSRFEAVREAGVLLRGRGALWVLELPSAQDAMRVAEAIYQRGVLVSRAGPYMRMLPAATIEPENLEVACTVIVEEVLRRIAMEPEVQIG